MALVNKSEQLRLGIFLVVAITVLVTTIGVLSGARLLEKRDAFFVRFSGAPVTGLEIGADVRYQGVRVGRVEDIHIDPVDLQTVIVDLSLRPATPIRADTQAVLQLQGITGLKMVELRAGNPLSPVLVPGSEIPASTTLVDRLGERAEGIADRLELVLEGLSGVVNPENRAALGALLAGAQSVSDSLGRAIGGINRLSLLAENVALRAAAVAARADSILLSESVSTSLENLAQITQDLREAHLDSLSVVAATTLSEARRAFTHLDLMLVQSREDILRSTESLREGADHMNEFSRLIAENPSRILRGGGEEEIEAPWRSEQP